MITTHIENYDKLYDIKYDKFNEGHRKTKITHINNINCFDIETSNGFVQENGLVIPFEHAVWNTNYKSGGVLAKPVQYKNPVSLEYVWQCAVENKDDIEVFIGRTWEDFKEFLNTYDDAISNLMVFGTASHDSGDPDYKSFMLQCKSYKKPILHFYVHNLGFEMQHLRNVFPQIKRLFAREKRKPMKFDVELNNTIVRFHDTLCLTQKKLENWAKDEKLPVQKLTGNLDYLEIKTPLTPLTKKEIDYCVNDVTTMVYGMQIYRKKYGDKLTQIPMTQTGEVRIVARKNISAVNKKWAEECYYIDHSYSWDFFNRLLQAFQGGWTHANEKYSGKLQGVCVESPDGTKGHPIVCWDFASSYPSVMTTAKFPISKFQECDECEIDRLNSIAIDDRDKVYLIVVDVYNVESVTWNTYFSSSKCIELEDEILDNGKVFAASHMKICVTDYDWDIFNKAYDFERYDIVEAYEADADYLPFEFIMCILDYYCKKTSLKDVDGAESAYNQAKQFINSLYGAAVTKIICDMIKFNGEWEKHSVTYEDFLELMEIPEDEGKLEKEIMQKFTTYQIGVWIPAIARHRLWDAILQFDSKIVYCDTDSTKGYFYDDDLKWFDDYNNYIKSLQEKVAAHYGFDPELYCPKTPEGKPKRLGIFAREDDCLYFKALRAKVYADYFFNKKTGKYEIATTIAGLPKKSGPKLIKKVDDLCDDLFWTPQKSEKLCAHYCDNQPHTIWVDKFGNRWESDDKYGVMLEPIGFDLSIASEYAYLLQILQTGECDYLNTPEIIRNYWEGEENVDD